MSPDGQSGQECRPYRGAIAAAVFPMAPGSRFDWHTHDDHQLAWASTGVLTVLTVSATWLLPPTRALWIPAGLRHEVRASAATTMRPLYVRPARCSIHWREPTVVKAGQLLAEMVAYLSEESLDYARRTRAEAVLEDLIEPVPAVTIDLRMPVDDRARAVAAGLVRDPADNRVLDTWGREVGASGRTLARAFVAETGMPFGRWRAMNRLRAALPALAAGQSVSAIARQVGYESPSAFVAAFRRELGTTPSAYFRGSD